MLTSPFAMESKESLCSSDQAEADGVQSNGVISNGNNGAPSSRKKQKLPIGQKTCRVCGDSALAHNFDVISCESCKAFFRRNALKTKVKACAFNDNCEITPETRRFCCHCRLKKCLASGMKPEMILGSDEKKALQEKIAENRRRKEKQHSQERQPEGKTPHQIQLTSPSSSSASLRHDHVSSATETPPRGGYSEDSIALDFDMPIKDALDSANSPFGFSSADQTMQMGWLNSQESTGPLESATKEMTLLDYVTMLPGTVGESDRPCENGLDPGIPFQHVRREQLPSDLRRYWRLKDEDRLLLADITSAYHDCVLKLPKNCSSAKLANVQSMLEKCQKYANDMVGFFKRVGDFRSLRLDDQLTTLKNSSWRIFIIKSMSNFIVESNAWMKEEGYMSVDLFVQISPEHKNSIEVLARFSSSLKNIVRNDPTVCALLQLIVLFDARYPNLSERQKVAELGDKYSLLLKHYAESQWSYDYAGHYLSAIRAKLQELPQVSREVHSMFNDWLEHLEPLTKELLNLD